MKTKKLKALALVAFIVICLSICLTGSTSKTVKKRVEYLHFTEEEIKSYLYVIFDGYITNVLPETTVYDFINNIDTDTEVKVYTSDGIEVESDQLVVTGMVAKVNDSEYKLIVKGDISETGKIGITDVVKAKLHNVNIRTLNGEYLMAADLNMDGEVTITDLTRINLALVKIVDLIAPITFLPEVTSTENAITISGKTSDANSGVAKYYFQIDNDNWVSNQDVKESTYTFEGLESDTEHTVRMMVEDKAGNRKITKKTIIKTQEAPTGSINIFANTTEWTNNDITISIDFSSNSENTKKLVSIDNGENWQEYNGPITITKNTIIKAKILDKDEQILKEDELIIENIDKTVPEDFEMNIVPTPNSITITATTEDAEATEEYGKSEIKEYRYILINGLWTWEETSTETTHTFTNLVQGNSYKIKVIAVDNAGNEKEAQNNEQLVVIPKIDDIIEPLGRMEIRVSTTEWTNEDVIVEVIFPQVEDLVKEISLDNGETWETYAEPIIATKNIVVKARVKDEIGQTSEIKEYKIENIDKLMPVNRNAKIEKNTNSIKIDATVVDEEATVEYGCSGIKGYSFKINDEEWTELQDLGEYIFDNLTQGTSYIIRIKAIDNAGNEIELQNSNQTIAIPTIDELIADAGEIEIKPSTTEWTNEDVIVEVIFPTIEGLVKEVSLDNGITWEEYTDVIAVSKNTTVIARMKDSTEQVGTPKDVLIENIDKLQPKDFEINLTSTRKTITVTAVTQDEESADEYGYSGIKEYKYILSDGVWTWEEISNDTIHTFENLTQGKKYSVNVVAVDNAGNEREALSVKEIQTLLVDTIEISANTTEWTNSGVIITVNYPEDTEALRKEISKDNGATWRDYTNMNTQIEVTDNTVVKARMMDGANQVGEEASYIVNNIDKLPPEEFIPETTYTTNSITVEGSTIDAETTQTDGSSGVKAYYFSKDNGETWVINETELLTTYTFTGLTNDTEYSIKMKAIDNAGNEYITGTNETTTEKIAGSILFESVWENEVPKVVITTDSSYSIEYKINEGEWTNYIEEVEASLNEVVYARLTDGVSAGDIVEYLIVDEDNPTLNVTVSSTDWTNEEVILSIEVTDNESGVASLTINGEEQEVGLCEYIVNENGEYNISVTDKAENTVSQTVNVQNIDKETPNAFETEVIINGRSITVEGDTYDEGSGLKGYYYSIDNGETWVTNEDETQTSYIFSELTNGNTYSVKMKAIDNVGNEYLTEAVEVTIDIEGPTIVVSGNAMDWTNEDITLVVLVTDEISGVESLTINGEQQEIVNGQIEYIVSTNGEYRIFATDGRGNLTIQTIVVDKLDKIAPNEFEAEVTVNGTSITAQGNTIDDGSGVKGYYYSIDNGENWISNEDETQAEYTFTELTHGNTYLVKIKVIDNAGNEYITEATEVTIDIEGPTLEVSGNSIEFTSEDITLVITVIDEISGVESLTINGEEQEIVDGQVEYIVRENGEYEITATDGSGNMTTQIIVVDKIDRITE